MISTMYKYAFLAWVGGSTYVTVEVFFRARSHWTMFVVAAVGVALPCFHLVTVLLPLFFPRIAVAFRPMFKGKEDLNETQQPGR